MTNAAIDGGFADPVFASQSVFRVVMDALAHPGRIEPLVAEAVPPAPLSRELGALALTLLDHDSPVWLDAPLAAIPAVADWLRFHTGAPIVDDRGQAMFALVADPMAMPALEAFSLGTDEYPDRSTTLLVDVEALRDGPALMLTGPGIESVATLRANPLPTDFVAQWALNRAQFPRGVDLVLVAPGEAVGLPRSTRIVEG